MSLYSLSPLFLSLLASSFFTDPQTGLDVPKFVTFLAILAGTVHFVGGFLLNNPPNEVPVTADDDGEFEETAPRQSDELSDVEEVDESAPLVTQSKPTAIIHPIGENHSTLDLLRDPYFWMMFFVFLPMVGSVSRFTSQTSSIRVLFADRNLHLV